MMSQSISYNCVTKFRPREGNTKDRRCDRNSNDVSHIKIFIDILIYWLILILLVLDKKTEIA